MPREVKAIPDGYHTITPYLIVRGAAEAIAYYEKAFGAVELFRIPGPGGRVGHAELRIGDSVVMLADEAPDATTGSPRSLGGSPVSLLLYVSDVDRTVAGAVAAGAKLQRPVEDKFYGDRMGGLEDPFGHLWWIATHIEDVTPEEMKRRIAAAGTS